MSCAQTDLLGALDGSNPAAAAHVRDCPGCREAMAALESLLVDLEQSYREDLQRQVSDLPAPAPGRARLPPKVRNAVSALRRRYLVETLRGRLDLGLDAAREMVDRMLGDGGLEPGAAPASPERLLDPEDDPTRDAGEEEEAQDPGDDEGPST